MSSWHLLPGRSAAQAFGAVNGEQGAAGGTGRLLPLPAKKRPDAVFPDEEKVVDETGGIVGPVAPVELLQAGAGHVRTGIAVPAGTLPAAPDHAPAVRL